MTTTGAREVVVSYDAGVTRIVLDRPQKKNALNRSMVAALKRALRAADDEERVRVISIRGAGSDFCSGADLGELKALTSGPVEQSVADVDALAELFLLIRGLRKPVVALVRGRALAGGCGLATACDLVLASDDATFGYPEVRLGFVPAIVAAILRRNVSEKRAFELIALGEAVSAREAESLGLINAVYPDEEFDSSADALLALLASRSSSAVQLCKRVLYRQDGLGFDAAVRAGADLNVIARMTADFRSGVERFGGDSPADSSES